MLQMAPRYRIPPNRLPPVPYPAKRRGLSAADRQLIRHALQGGPPLLPTDVPDLAPLLDQIDAVSGAAESAA